MSDELLDLLINELRTPLTSCFLHEALLRKTDNNPQEVKHLLQNIQEDLTSINTVLDTVILYKHVQKNTLLLQKEKVPLQEFFMLGKDFTSSCHIVKLATNIRIKSGDFLYIDKLLIQKAMGILFDNAAKFSQKDIFVTYQTTKRSFQVIIQDFGIGMTHKQKKQLSTLPENIPMTSSYPGLRINLFIAIHVIKKHNGKLTIKSTLGKGTTCVVSLPLYQEK